MVKEKYPGPKDRLSAAAKGTVQGLRHRAQGKNIKRKRIFSLCLVPYTSSAGKAIEL
jgi:hypothetical protein